MEAKLVTLRSRTKRSFFDIRKRLQETLPNLDSFVSDVRVEVSSAVEDAVIELQTAHNDLLKLLAKSPENDDCRPSMDDATRFQRNVRGASSLPCENSDDDVIMCQKRASFLHDTLHRIRNRLDDIYRNDESTKVPEPKCDLDQVADLINRGASKDALRIIIKNSSNIDDVFKLTAEALERAGGVNPNFTKKLKIVDYAGMCAKYASTRNKSITTFVDDVLYEALLDGKISASDFSDRYQTLEEVEFELEQDQDTANENAKRFLRLLTKTLIPVTSVTLKVCAIIGLTVFSISPLSATFLCASALMLDTLNEFVKSRMVLDMFATYLSATVSGECVNDLLSDKYVTLSAPVRDDRQKACRVLQCGGV